MQAAIGGDDLARGPAQAVGDKQEAGFDLIGGGTGAPSTIRSLGDDPDSPPQPLTSQPCPTGC